LLIIGCTELIYKRMKTSKMEKRLLFFLSVTLVMITMLSSCNKIEENRDVYIDSYINSIFDKKGVPVYAVMHTAYSFAALNSVKVTGSGGSSVQLGSMSNGGFSFYSILDSASYKSTIPDPANYTYAVTYDDGETASKSNAILAKSLSPAQQLNAVKSSTEIVLSWKAVTNAEAYKIRIFREDASTKENVLIYESDYLIPKVGLTDLSIPFSLSGFSTYIDSNLSFEVSAFIFEQKQDTFHAVSVTTIKKYFGV
jgi:hypothetical protein